MSEQKPSAAKHSLSSWLLISGAVLGLALPNPSALAKDDSDKRYAVEIIVFRHNDQTRTTREIEAGAVRLDSLADGNSQPVRTGRRGSTPLSPLPAAELELQATKERLQRVNAYSILLHLGWTQIARSRDEASPFWLRGPRARSLGLSGSLTLYKERFLHLDLDLDLAKAASNAEFNPSPAGMTKIRESRRIRGQLLQYFDNPEFGVIASVRRLEEN